VPVVLQFSPVALEMLDHTVFRNLDVEVSPRVIDSDSDGGSLLLQIDLQQKLTSTTLETVTDENSSNQIWGARKSALNNAMKMTVGSRKPVGLIEDTVVSPDILYDYSRFLLQKYNDNKLDYVIYGHAGNGNLHTRPMIDTESKSELELFNIVAHEVFTKVISCGGTITGEHGDGIARTKYMEFMYGLQVVSIFEQIKKLFDPKFIMNPGKKVIRSDLSH
jgi:FAD/FMN-containing dehydrogenase